MLMLASTIAATAATAAVTSELKAFIAGVQEQAHLAAPLRADIHAEIDGAEGRRTESITVVQRSRRDGKAGREIFLQVGDAKERYLIRGLGEASVADGAHSKKAGIAQVVASSTWTLEDLLPFDESRCLSTRIIDTSASQMTLSCEVAPKSGSQYSLIVYKVDREKLVPVQTLLYQGTLSNLVKMMRASDFEQVGGKWLPKRVVMQDFKVTARDVFEIRWEQNPKLPEGIFEPASFGKASLSPSAR